jgi:uncharacterized protein (TIGR03067 family)
MVGGFPPGGFQGGFGAIGGGPAPGGTPTAGKDGTWAVWADSSLLFFQLNLSLKDAQYQSLLQGLETGMVKLRAMAELGEARPRAHDLARALQEYAKEKSAFPQGALPRPANADRVLDWRPDQRLSWMAEVLDYLPESDYKELKPDMDKSWNEGKNLQIAAVPVPQFVMPVRGKDVLGYYVRYPGQRFSLAATHFVGVAGIGLDAAEYAANDPAVAKKLGAFGYDRVTKLEDVKDGLANTIVAIQVPPEHATPWLAGGGSTVRGVSEDDDCVRPFVCAEHNGVRGTFAIMGDGKVRFIPETIPAATFRALCTIAGGEQVKDLDKIAPVVDAPEGAELKAESVPPADKPKPTDPPKTEETAANKADLELLQGTWQPVRAEEDGKAVPAELLRELGLTITGDKADLKHPGGTDRATLRIDASKTPKWIDFKSTDGKSGKNDRLAIYEVSADELKICTGLSSDSKRPDALRTTPGSQLKLLVCQRVKR